MRSELRSVRERLGVARSNQRASQRALAQRLNEIYRAHPLDTLGVLLASRSFADISEGLDLLDRLSRADGSLVRSARRWRLALERQSRTLRHGRGARTGRAGRVGGARRRRCSAPMPPSAHSCGACDASTCAR